MRGKAAALLIILPALFIVSDFLYPWFGKLLNDSYFLCETNWQMDKAPCYLWYDMIAWAVALLVLLIGVVLTLVQMSKKKQ